MTTWKAASLVVIATSRRAQHPISQHTSRRHAAMDLDGVGARCALSTCRMLDYLPFRCASCSQLFCAEHQTPAAHTCAAAPASARFVPTCPMCNEPVPVPPGRDPNVVMASHIDQGCPRRKRSNPKCALSSCSVRDPAATVCKSCTMTFCIQHRLETDHECTFKSSNAKRLPFTNPFGAHVTMQQLNRKASPAPAETAKKADGSKTRSPRRSRKASSASPAARASASRSGSAGARAPRLDFANTPQSPRGDARIDIEERISLAVYFPIASGIQPLYFVFNHRHSAGKLIDQILQSVTALVKPPAGSRYHLYAVKRNFCGVNLLPHITPLRDLPHDVLQSGDILVLEHDDKGLSPEWYSALSGGSSSSSRMTFMHSKGSKKCILS